MEQVGAGIVSYNPEMTRLKENVDGIIDQVERLVFVDNGSKNIDEIKKEYGSNPKIEIICNGENRGIAAALNQIMDWGEEKGYRWVLTLDQDSIPLPGMVEEMGKYLDTDKYGFVTPKILYKEFPHRKSSNKIETVDCKTIDFCQTSGSLSNIKAIKEVGGFDEKLFIDEVDIDMSIRLRLAGYQLLRVIPAKIKHQIGNTTEVFIFPRLAKILKWKVLTEPRYPYNHPAIRKYYIVRNNIYVIRKYKNKIDLSGKKKAFHKVVRTWLVAEPLTWEVIKATVKGAVDGYRMPLDDK